MGRCRRHRGRLLLWLPMAFAWELWALLVRLPIHGAIIASNTGKWSWSAAGRGFIVGAVGGGAAKYLGRRGW